MVMMQLPTEDQCKQLFEAALGKLDWNDFERVYSVEYQNGVFYCYANHKNVTWAIKVSKHYDTFRAGFKLRPKGEDVWQILMVDVLEFSRVASEMLKNWKWG
jgi:hypothetical protein